MLTRADPAADAAAVGLGGHRPVVHPLHLLGLPTEQIAVEGAQGATVLADDLEPDHRGAGALAVALHIAGPQADDVALGVGEQADLAAGNVHRPHDLGAATRLGLCERLIDVVHPDVERDVAGRAVGGGADAAGRPALAGRDDAVRHVAGNVRRLPAEELGVEVDQALLVGACDLEEHRWVAHLPCLLLGVLSQSSRRSGATRA